MADLIQTAEQRLDRLERYVAKVEDAIKELEKSVARGDLESLDEREIQFYLSHAPDMIAESGLLLAKIQRAYDYAKLDSKLVFGKIWREANENKDKLNLSNAKDRDAYCLGKSEYKEVLQQEYEWKYNTTRAELIYDRYNNMFISARKLAGMLPQYYQAQDNYAKYNRED